MDTIISVIASIISVIVSGAVSWHIAKAAANAEIKKLELTWAHEKQISIDSDFDKMVAYVSYFAKNNSPNSYKEAIDTTAFYRTKATGEMAKIIDSLSQLLIRNNTNSLEIEKLLDKAVEHKRKSNS